MAAKELDAMIIKLTGMKKKEKKKDIEDMLSLCISALVATKNMMEDKEKEKEKGNSSNIILLSESFDGDPIIQKKLDKLRTNAGERSIPGPSRTITKIKKSFVESFSPRVPVPPVPRPGPPAPHAPRPGPAPAPMQMNNHTIEELFEYIVSFVRHKKQDHTKLQKFIAAYKSNPMSVFKGIYKLWSNSKQAGNDNILNIDVEKELTPPEIIQLLNEIVNNM